MHTFNQGLVSKYKKKPCNSKTIKKTLKMSKIFEWTSQTYTKSQ